MISYNARLQVNFRSRHYLGVKKSQYNVSNVTMGIKNIKKHVASERVWASYSPTVNGQGLYSISPLKKVWASYSPTVNGQGLCNISPLSYSPTVNEYEYFISKPCLFTKFEVCCYVQTILMQVLEEYLDIHKSSFKSKEPRQNE